jgi:hypothetical protein
MLDVTWHEIASRIIPPILFTAAIGVILYGIMYLLRLNIHSELLLLVLSGIPLAIFGLFLVMKPRLFGVSYWMRQIRNIPATQIINIGKDAFVDTILPKQ